LSPFRHPDDQLARIDDRRRRAARGGLRGRRGRVIGKRRVQRRRRHPFGGFGSADHDPIARRILYQMCGIARWDHAEFAGGFGKRGCGLRLEHVALEGLFLL
jgi:hypothetical protein